jgi:hypothetical protein
MLAMALAAFAVSVWLLLSGRLFLEGIDAKFLFAVGFVLGTSFLTIPVLSVRDGLLSDLRELWREEARRSPAIRTSPRRAWQQSHAH